MNQENVIVIYGGSFNPPHNVHFTNAQQVLNEYNEVEKVVFVPVSKRYEKSGLIDDKYRYEMLKIVIDKNERFVLSDIDMHGAYSYSLSTIETLEKLQEQFQDKKLWVLIGSDNLKEIHTWKRVEELLTRYTILVIERGKDCIEDIIQSSELLQRYQNNIKKINIEIKSNFSSTSIRKQIKNGKSIRYLVPDGVYEYIEKNKLYKG